MKFSDIKQKTEDELTCAMEKIRKLFRVDTNYQLIIVNIVFAVTGTLALYLAGDVINLIGIKESEVSSFIFWTLRIIIIILELQL